MLESRILPHSFELSLSQWLTEKRNRDVTVRFFHFHKTGTGPLLENHRLLTERLSTDGVGLGIAG